ncbi:MAG: hypothetical protein AAF959_25515 [Cyanobacteria bacterium P01_D01_bin.56]
MKPHPKRRPRRQRRYRLISSATLLLLGIGLGLGLRFQANAASATQDLCQTILSSQTVLSRQQLTQLLTVPERENRQTIEAIAQEPYCTLAAIKVRADVEAERAAYPLAFDPNTWLVVLYEDQEYVGYDFKLHH